jgi:excisionase family DNA binding protein
MIAPVMGHTNRQKIRTTKSPHEGDMLVDCRRAAEILGLEVSTVRKWVVKGRIQSVRLSPRARRFRLSDLHNFIADRVCPELAERGI